MPFSIRKVGKNKYQVYNTATGEIHSKGTTKKKAEGQFRLLQGIHRKELINLEGGAKRSRSPMNWEAERQRLIIRLNDLDARNTDLITEQENVVRDELPELPEALLGDNPNENFITKYEIFSEYIESEQRNRDFEFPALEEQGLLEDALQWINTIPINIIRTSIVRDRQRDELREEMREVEEDIEELDDTAERENTMGDEDSGTEMEGYGRRKGGWNFKNRNYNPLTVGYNALFNGATENYRNDITKEGVRQDIDRNIKQAKEFAKNPNPEAFAQKEVMGQASRYGSGHYQIPSQEYQPRRFL